MKIFDGILQDGITWLFGSIVACGLWIFRNVLTNNKKIELLENDIKHANAMRDKHDRWMEQIQEKVNKIAVDVARKR